MAGQKVGPSRFEVNWVVCSGKGIICPTIERVFQLVVIDWDSDELNFSVPIAFLAQVPTCTLSSIESCGFMTHGLPVTHLAFSVASLPFSFPPSPFPSLSPSAFFSSPFHPLPLDYDAPPHPPPPTPDHNSLYDSTPTGLPAIILHWHYFTIAKMGHSLYQPSKHTHTHTLLQVLPIQLFHKQTKCSTERGGIIAKCPYSLF